MRICAEHAHRERPSESPSGKVTKCEPRSRPLRCRQRLLQRNWEEEQSHVKNSIWINKSPWIGVVHQYRFLSSEPADPYLTDREGIHNCWKSNVEGVEVLVDNNVKQVAALWILSNAWEWHAHQRWSLPFPVAICIVAIKSSGNLVWKEISHTAVEYDTEQHFLHTILCHTHTHVQCSDFGSPVHPAENQLLGPSGGEPIGPIRRRTNWAHPAEN